MSKRVLLLVTLALACVGVTGCGGGGDEAAETPTEAPTLAPATDEATTEAAAEPLSATLGQGYKVVGGRNEGFQDAELPVPPGTVEATWYVSAGRYVVVYSGIPAEAGPLCPGNSLESGGTFDHVSNSPTAEGACTGAPRIAAEPVQTCGQELVYVTEIPADSSGTLYASVERYEGNTITGVTGSVATGEAPEVELSELGC